jgi:hypothetical protein
MSLNKYINLGLGFLVACMCGQGVLFCCEDSKGVGIGNRLTVHAIQIDLEVSDVVDAA